MERNRRTVMRYDTKQVLDEWDLEDHVREVIQGLSVENEKLKQELFEFKRTPNRAGVEQVIDHYKLIIVLRQTEGPPKELTADEVMSMVDPNACQCVVNGIAMNNCSKCPR